MVKKSVPWIITGVIVTCATVHGYIVALNDTITEHEVTVAEQVLQIDAQKERIEFLNDENSHLLKIAEFQDQLSKAGKEYKVMEGHVTAYSPYENYSGIECEGNPNCTATGTKPGPGTIAVDPARIPYGSEIIIIYDDGMIETGIACDTGSALRKARGLVIDVFRHTYKETKFHGRKEATIIWKLPKEEKK